MHALILMRSSLPASQESGVKLAQEVQGENSGRCGAYIIRIRYLMSKKENEAAC